MTQTNKLIHKRMLYGEVVLVSTSLWISRTFSQKSEIPSTIDAKSHAFGVRLTLFDPISRYHAIETEYHAFFKILQIEEKVLINLN